MQPFDFTTQAAVCWELQTNFLPARLETVYQRDRHTLYLGLRTFQGRSWLTICWDPQAARIHLGAAPPKDPDTFAFSQQIQSQIKGLALSQIVPISPWERALDLQFAARPEEPPLWHLYVEIMGKYSNVLLVNGDSQVVTAARQVNDQQSRVRAIQTGQPYSPPPSLQEARPSLEESQQDWQERVALVPGEIAKNLRCTYRGLSSQLSQSLVAAAGLDAQQSSASLTAADWQRLFAAWRHWLFCLDQGRFEPGWTERGYGVLGWGLVRPAQDTQHLLDTYYGQQRDRQQFNQIQHQLYQKLKTVLTKLRRKAQGFEQRLSQSASADALRAQADLLMAHLQDWQPGLTQMVLNDFATGVAVAIALNPEYSAVQNAQKLYKQHQKLKRARLAVQPLLAEVQAEIHYLEQVEDSLDALGGNLARTEGDREGGDLDRADLTALLEIRDELVQQGYLADPTGRHHRNVADSKIDFHRYQSPSGITLLIGRNNRQNDQLSFRIAKDYDLWLHSQEIPGSHALLRLEPGMALDPVDLQWAADLAALHSRARQSDQVPVVYTQPRHVYKPKGANPGMVIYKHEQVIWGQPQRAKRGLEQLPPRLQ